MFESLAASVFDSAEDFWAWFLDKPLTIILILLFGTIAIGVLRRVVTALAEGIAAGQKPRAVVEQADPVGAPGIDVPGAKRRRKNVLMTPQALADALVAANPRAAERRAQRARTVGSVLNSTINVVIGTVMVLWILQVIGMNIAPLIATAGVAGVAIGFGAQTLVKDFISGIFLLIEDQFGVGDNVDLGGGVIGTVEAMGLRLTQVRAFDGTLWYVRNGEILRAGNRTQEWSRAVASVQVPLGTDVDAVRAALGRAADRIKDDPELAQHLLETPSVRGVDAVDGAGLTFTLHAQVRPAQQWAVARSLRVAAHAELLSAGIVARSAPTPTEEHAVGDTPGVS
ncbi:mechanosensitive ion channel family protein [Promicromonospora thailandica]|uniref:Small conductance mechanosensitive channel n=1 Tax=Promicromonospora thailandica TaxID=765201 RepID=A0A9X2FZY7_9MICO|nr:mechanosensitive ion channel family protein [Promicromonospora thailandica]MCP2262843.1 small conductance mechanosensitive channel [Promicromonospora thailandica]BFF18179.1 mechanosensitive ion channel family protein [Promicromonospora thailandica]